MSEEAKGGGMLRERMCVCVKERERESERDRDRDREREMCTALVVRNKTLFYCFQSAHVMEYSVSSLYILSTYKCMYIQSAPIHMYLYVHMPNLSYSNHKLITS